MNSSDNDKLRSELEELKKMMHALGLSSGGGAGNSLAECPAYTGVVVVARVAQSGQATVYKGIFRSNTVAVKVFHEDESGGGIKLDEYRDEINNLLALRHPNVLQLVTCFEQPRPCIITEFMPGGDLFKHIKAKGKLSSAEAWQLARGIARGLAYLHERGVIHRDLKSPNILLNDKGEPVLADFGFARLSVSTMTVASNVVGTWRWLAPEMMQGHATGIAPRYNNRVDVYAFGIILWELLSGQVPHADKNVMQLLSFVSSGGRPPVDPAWDRRMVDLMKRCWQQDPTHRPAMADIVREYFPDEPAGVTSSPTSSTSTSTSTAGGLTEAEDMYRAALGYAHGDHGEAQNLPRAVELFGRASVAGHAGAQRELHEMCKDKRWDPREAEAWLRRAAGEGHAFAQCTLGWMLWRGHGVPASRDQAAEWWLKAAEQGHALAQSNVGVAYENGTDRLKNPAEAVKWFRRSAESGLALGQYNLGRAYEKGIGLACPSEREAAPWYLKAAKQGHPDAQFALGSMYAAGRGVTLDRNKAREWLEKAAAQDHTEARRKLKSMFPSSSSPSTSATSSPGSSPSPSPTVSPAPKPVSPAPAKQWAPAKPAPTPAPTPATKPTPTPAAAPAPTPKPAPAPAPKPADPPKTVSPLVQVALDADVCTFVVTRDKFTPQKWYHCYTCGMDEHLGCCETCAKTCHKGHNLSTVPRLTDFYCDCGAGATNFKCRSIGRFFTP